MSYAVRHTAAFKRDYKLALRRHLPVEKLHAVVEKLQNGIPLPREDWDIADMQSYAQDLMNAGGKAALFTDRLDEISRLAVPMEKTGIAHLTCRLLYREGTVAEVVRRMDEKRLKAIFRRFADRGAGIELNAVAFRELDDSPAEILLLYSIAKDCGCRFYCASDAHRLSSYRRVEEVLPRVVAALGLTAEDRYVIPKTSRE